LAEREIYSFIADEEDSGERIDNFLSEQIPGLSRSRIQKAIRSGDVLLGDERIRKPSKKLHTGDSVELRFSPPRPPEISPENIPIDVVYEDDSLLVVDKEAGMVVHPAPGHETGTLVHALLAHCRNLSGIGGVLRPGIVHRLDSGTSGLLVVAKNDKVHISLSRQMMNRKVGRTYFAVVWGEMPSSSGVIDLPIGRSPHDRKRMAVLHVGGREAVTSYYVLDTFRPFQYIKLELGTGRTHQIRVHLSHVGHSVLGDPIYGGRRVRKGTLSRKEIEIAERVLSLIGRQALHAGEISFVHPVTGEELTVKSPLPSDFGSVLGVLRGSKN
jgi:23S rRNA pseudouridine1911/1915/1917 synthase